MTVTKLKHFYTSDSPEILRCFVLKWYVLLAEKSLAELKHCPVCFLPECSQSEISIENLGRDASRANYSMLRDKRSFKPGGF